MPIDNIAARYRELGRLKFGEDLGDRPAQLTTWRLTSPSSHLIEAAARLWGGDVFHKAEGGSEVVTEAEELEALIPPQDVAAGQWWELWTAGGLQRRCSGFAVVEFDDAEPDGWRKVGPCICDEENGPRSCKPTTVLRVLLPQLPDLGVWRLVTRSLYAASEIPAAAAFLLQAAQGNPAPAVLALDARSSKKPGQKPHHYIVPVLRTRSTLAALAASPSSGIDQALPLETGQAPRGPETDPSLPAAEPGLDIPASAPQSLQEDSASQPGESSGAQTPEPDQIEHPRRSPEVQALADFLNTVDPGDLPRDIAELTTILDTLEALTVAADIWKPGALDAASDKWLKGRAWRAVPDYELRTFTQRAVLAVLGRKQIPWSHLAEGETV